MAVGTGGFFFFFFFRVGQVRFWHTDFFFFFFFLSFILEKENDRTWKYKLLDVIQKSFISQVQSL